MQNKEKLMQKLIDSLSRDNKLEKYIVKRKDIELDVGLVNHYALHNQIPNKWFDWVRRADSPIMIIGQDWGPYSALQNFIDDYKIEKTKDDFDYEKFLFNGFSSRTEKFIIRSLTNNYLRIFNKDITQKDWDLFFFTVAVLLTRKGHLFRGNDNFEPKVSLSHSYPYLIKQIEIVDPKLIMPLGGMAWESLAKYFRLDYGKTITEVINNLPSEGYIKVKDIYIIPNFHPASHVDPKIIDKQFAKIWEIVKQEGNVRI